MASCRRGQAGECDDGDARHTGATEMNNCLIRLGATLLLLFSVLGVGWSPLVDDAAAQGVTSRVRFAPGSSSATLKGAIVRGDRDVYILGAKGGQSMSVNISSIENNAVFQIRSPGGSELRGAREGDDAMQWSGTLPASGDYRIIVGGTRGNASYTLRISIR
jgi:hypothetical protein